MSAISKLGLALVMAAIVAAPVPAFAARKPHGYRSNRCAQVYAQPRVYEQPSVAQPQVAATQGRRTFSYEPAAPVTAAPRYVAPFRAAPQHTWENATMKGLGQFR